MNKQSTLFKPLSSIRGLTLVETMIVLVVFALLAAFVGPELMLWRPKLRIKQTADHVVEDLQRAKVHAIKNNVTVAFTFTTGCPGGSYSFTDTLGTVVANSAFNTTNQNQGICLSATTYAAGDGFSSRGLPTSATARTITIRSNILTRTGDPFYIITQSLAGGISMQRNTLP